MVAMAVAVGLQLVLKFLQLHFLRRLKIALAARMTSRFFWHLLRLPMSFYAQRFPGEISNRTTLNDRVADTLSGKLATTSIDLCTMVFYAAVMFYYDTVLTAIGVAFASLNFLALRRLSKRRVEANMRLAQESGKMGAVALAALYNMESVKASGAESAKFVQWSGHYAHVANARLGLEQSSVVLGVLPSFLSTLTTTLILVAGGFRVISGEISIGMLVAFQALMAKFLEPVGNLVDLGKLLQELHGELLRLDDVLTNPTATAIKPATVARSASEGISGPSDPTLTRSVSEATPGDTPSDPRLRVGLVSAGNGHSPRLRGELEIRDLAFGYSPLADPLVAEFSLHIRPGERVALVGASGSGKSTIAKLISGLYDPWQGSILFDGEPRNRVPAAVLSKVERGAPAGPRRYLFTCRKGEAVFGLADQNGHDGYGLLAVGLEDSTLHEIPLAPRAESLAGAESETVAAAECWIDKLTAVLLDGSPQPFVERIPSQDTVRVSEGQVVGSGDRTIHWFQVEQGRVSLCGVAGIEFHPASGAFPLSGDGWLRAMEASVLRRVRPEQTAASASCACPERSSGRITSGRDVTRASSG